MRINNFLTNLKTSTNEKILPNLHKIVVLIFCTLSLQAQNEIPDNKGREFWVMFNTNNDNTGVNLSLFITGDIETTGAVELPDGSTKDFTIVPGIVNTVEVPSALIASTTDGIENKGIRVLLLMKLLYMV